MWCWSRAPEVPAEPVPGVPAEPVPGVPAGPVAVPGAEAVPGSVPVPGRGLCLCPVPGGVVAWVLSGRGAGAVRELAARVAAVVQGPGVLAGGAAAGVAEAAGVAAGVGVSLAGRAVFEDRAVVVGSGLGDLAAGLGLVARGEPGPGVAAGRAGRGGVVLVFPGQGSQWPGMGRDLAAASPVFARRLAQCADALSAAGAPWRLADVLADPGGTALGDVNVVQPALWAVMVALAGLWESWGVVPSAVIGHSQGEIAAAAVAGVLPLEQAARVVLIRSRALRALSGTGGMMSAGLGGKATAELIARLGLGGVAVAAVNGPGSVVVSGDLPGLDTLEQACKAGGIRVKRVPVDYASHCPLVNPVRGDLAARLAGIRGGTAAVPWLSTVTGNQVAGPEIDAGYWFENLRRPVRFEHAVRAAAAAGHQVFIECSPHPVLVPGITEILDDLPAQDGRAVTGTLRRDDGGLPQMMMAAAEAFTAGAPVDWPAIIPPGRRVDLPTYPFQRQRLWLEPARGAGDPAGLGVAAAGHPLLAVQVPLAGSGDLVLAGQLPGAGAGWLPDHAVAGTVLLPGAGFAELALAAGQRAGCPRVDELTLHAPLVIPAGDKITLQVTITAPGPDGRRPLTIHSTPTPAAGNGTGTRNTNSNANGTAPAGTSYPAHAASNGNALAGTAPAGTALAGTALAGTAPAGTGTGTQWTRHAEGFLAPDQPVSGRAASSLASLAGPSPPGRGAAG